MIWDVQTDNLMYRLMDGRTTRQLYAPLTFFGEHKKYTRYTCTYYRDILNTVNIQKQYTKCAVVLPTYLFTFSAATVRHDLDTKSKKT